MTHSRQFRLILSLITMAAIAPGCVKEIDPAQALEATKLTLADAVKAAAAAIDDGTPIEVELSVVDGHTAFDVDFADGDELKGVTVDGTTGAVGAPSDQAATDKERFVLEAFDKISKKDRISLVKAIQKAESDNGGAKAYEADLKLIKDVPHFVIRVSVNGEGKKVEIPVGG